MDNAQPAIGCFVNELRFQMLYLVTMQRLWMSVLK